MSKPEHICGRDCDYDADRGCPMEAPGPEDWDPSEEDMALFLEEQEAANGDAHIYPDDPDYEEYPGW
jgi:hypothetical protein